MCVLCPAPLGFLRMLTQGLTPHSTALTMELPQPPDVDVDLKQPPGNIVN